MPGYGVGGWGGNNDEDGPPDNTPEDKRFMFGFCPQCKHVLHEGQAYCTSCGEDVPGGIRPTTTPAPAAKKLCMSCNGGMQKLDRFCEACGVEAPPPPKPACKHCQAEMGPGQAYCPKCYKPKD